ncbi:MAG: hypothetical protein WDN06_03570 [Asticcacaulis sp.]
MWTVSVWISDSSTTRSGAVAAGQDGVAISSWVRVRLRGSNQKPSAAQAMTITASTPQMIRPHLRMGTVYHSARHLGHGKKRNQSVAFCHDEAYVLEKAGLVTCARMGRAVGAA